MFSRIAPEVCGPIAVEEEEKAEEREEEEKEKGEMVEEAPEGMSILSPWFAMMITVPRRLTVSE